MAKSRLLAFILVALVNLFALGGYCQERNYPQRIISLGPALTEELYLLGVQDRLVGCTIYCNRPAAAKNKPKVGTALELNLERIVGLKPDLVLATNLTSQHAKQKLKSLGIKVVEFKATKNFDDICQQFLKLAELVGKPEVAQEIIVQARSKVERIAEKTAQYKATRVFVQMAANPLVTAGANSFVDNLLKLAGGENIVKASGHCRYSREMVLKEDPEVIIIITMGIDGVRESKVWKKFVNLSAEQDNRIYIVDPDKITSPTPLIFADTLELIAGYLHPDTKSQ